MGQLGGEIISALERLEHDSYFVRAHTQRREERRYPNDPHRVGGLIPEPHTPFPWTINPLEHRPGMGLPVRTHRPKQRDEIRVLVQSGFRQNVA